MLSSTVVKTRRPGAAALSIRRGPSAMTIMANVILASSAVSAVSGAKTASPLLPYIPTTILIPGSAEEGSTNSTSSSNSTAYIFSPSDAGDSVDLLSLDVSSTLASASLASAVTTLTSGLPFLSSSNTTTFSPTLAADGSIVVFAGDCASDNSSSVWVYNASSSGKPSWEEQQGSSLDGTTGPSFLGGGLAFSEVIAPTVSAPQIYSYGGQCPNATLNGSTTWVNAADYSNAMIKLTPSSSSSDGYEARALSLASQPVAEAGFTFTQLAPSTSNISGTVTQTVNSIVLGGHTRNAFVNISTAAIWSLPEESWSYVAISGPSGAASSSSSTSSELAKDGDAAVQVQSRSGHTAVLNQAGTALIILGGWVGNTSTPAEPQLVVLDLSGTAFGEWAWVVPDDQPLTGGEGIYGHGAALLPGNVMMVAGGYSISSSSSSSSASKLRSRDDIGVAGGQLKTFLNLTSLSWSDSYTNPTRSSSSGTGSHSSSSSSSSSSTDDTKLGLEIGLGVGIPLLLIALCVAFFCFRRRQRRRHAHRDEHIRSLTTGTPFITPEEMYETEHEHEQQYPWVPKAAARWYSYTGGHDPYPRHEKSLGYESLRGQRGGQQQQQQHHDFGGLAAMEPPLGYRGPTRRKPNPRVAQGLYQPTGVDESRTFAAISPIMEDEEDEMSMHGAMSPDREVEGAEDDPFVTPVNDTTPSPFAVGNTNPPSSPTTDSPDHVYDHEYHTPTLMPTLVQPQQQQQQHPEVTGWVTDVDASDALITRRLQPRGASVRMGRISPTRRSSVRFADGESTPTTPGARTESGLSDSNRSAFSFLGNRSDSLRGAAAGAGGGLLAASGASGAEKRGGTSHSDHSSSSHSNSSFITAKSIPTLQTEGPALLLGRPRPISDIEDLTHVSDDDGAPGSPSKSKPPRRSWFGSLRRVFSGPGSSSSSAEGSSRAESPTRGDTSDYDRWGLGGGLGLGGYGLLQKRKQGRSAWEEYVGGGAGGPGGGHGDGHEDEEDWDVERSAEQRLVQVMFSVPKERLRIVNGEPDVISIEESAVIVDPERDSDDDGADDDTIGEGGGDGRRRPSPISEEDQGPEVGRKAGDGGDNILHSKKSSTGEEEEQRMRSLGEAEARDRGKQPEETAPFLLEQKSFESATYEKKNKKKTQEDSNNNNKEEEKKGLLEQRSFESATNEKVRQDERKARLLEVPQRRGSEDSSYYEGRRRSFSPGIPMQAEEIRYERPRTRVLDLVESFEQRSRSNSPTKERLTPERSW